MDIPPGGCSCPLFPRRVGISKNGFCRGKKTGGPGEKPSEQEREPTTNSIHMWQQLRESNPDPRVGGERSHFAPFLLPFRLRLSY